MQLHLHGGKRVRFCRLLNESSDSLLLVPLDHSVADGPITTGSELVRLARIVADNGADGLILHKGRVRFLPPELFRHISLIVHLSGSTAHAPDADAKILLALVEEAVELGADAVSVHVNLGSATETRQLGDLGQVAERCSRWGMPLLAMIYPRGPQIIDPAAEHLVAHAASIAADLGADIVKTPYTGDLESMARVVASCPIPVVTAGGAPVHDDDTLSQAVSEVMASGALGVAMGRNIFRSNNPAETTRRVAEAVHAGRAVAAVA
ncbi:2-amino-3,7-dideoxy-D-threo-hept-6-ulosonate synthase [Nocardia wallacei]|nr:2-amino-3,7-dideoxy-D-threo-hept-6-ulosonate synthase [Nocardia wallacei]